MTIQPRFRRRLSGNLEAPSRGRRRRRGSPARAPDYRFVWFRSSRRRGLGITGSSGSRARAGAPLNKFVGQPRRRGSQPRCWVAMPFGEIQHSCKGLQHLKKTHTHFACLVVCCWPTWQQWGLEGGAGSKYTCARRLAAMARRRVLGGTLPSGSRARAGGRFVDCAYCLPLVHHTAAELGGRLKCPCPKVFAGSCATRPSCESTSAQAWWDSPSRRLGFFNARSLGFELARADTSATQRIHRHSNIAVQHSPSCRLFARASVCRPSFPEVRDSNQQ